MHTHISIYKHTHTHIYIYIYIYKVYFENSLSFKHISLIITNRLINNSFKMSFHITLPDKFTVTFVIANFSSYRNNVAQLEL